MNSYNEIIQYDDPTLAIKIFEASPQKRDLHTENWHYHKELEIIIVLDGSMELVIKEEVFSLSKGDVFLIGPNEVHLDQRLDVHYIVFQFDVFKFFEPSLAPFSHSLLNPHMCLSKLNYIFQQDEYVRKKLFQLVFDIHQEYMNRFRGYEVAINIKIKEILLTLLRHDTKLVLDEYSSVEIERLRPVLQYIANNLTEDISADQCCQIINLNYHYFVKLFKKTLGLTFIEYIQHERIKLAERILLTEQLSIEEVAELSGFHNMGHFYKTFQKYHNCTPSSFKKMRQNQTKKIIKMT